MIVVERDRLAEYVRDLKQKHEAEPTEYDMGYVTAMTLVEAMLAIAPAYDLGRIADMPHPGLFTPEEVCLKMVEHGQGNYKRFKLGETIEYSPSEVEKILKGELPKEL